MTLKNKSKTKVFAQTCLPAMMAMVPLSVLPQQANAQVSIVVSGTAELNFGEISAVGGAGTVTITPGGARTKTGAVTLLAGAGLESPATLSISGSLGLMIEVSLTNSVFPIDNPGPGAPMNVGAFNINGGGNNVTVTLTTNPSTFPMGATLTIPGGQPNGVYSGTYTVNANYN